ncbi:MAG: glycoside hydrolase family 88 protein [Prevotella sp.]|jgi:rhamnogalacturonyl hydrolase YesR|nr:glycoside hydrolase family 88 protein [Prevotella sp.]
MKQRIFLFSLLTIGCIAAYAVNPEEFQTFPKGSEPESVGQRIARRYISVPYRNFDENKDEPPYIVYPETCTWFGTLRFAQVTNDKKLLRQLEERFFPLLGARKELMQKPNHVDNTVFGVIPLQLYLQTGNELYYHIGIDFADRQWEMPKNLNPDAEIAYKAFLDKGLSWQTRFWIDDMFMITSVQSQAYLASKDEKYINRAAYEMTVYLDSIQRPNGLFFHAKTAPFFWGRGNGWMAAGMTDLLKYLPDSNPDRQRILREYRKMMATLKSYQNEKGLWNQLIDRSDAWGETSGSAMFTYAMLTGVRKGWLDVGEYAPVARKAWLSLVGCLNDNGDLRDVCIGTNIGSTKEHYINRKRLVGDFHGQAALLWCAVALLEK